MRGEKTERNLRLYEDSNTLSTRELAKKYNLSTARVSVIVNNLRSLQNGKPDRLLTAIQQTEDRLLAIGIDVDLALRDLRALRRLVESVNVSSKQGIDQ